MEMVITCILSAAALVASVCTLRAVTKLKWYLQRLDHVAALMEFELRLTKSYREKLLIRAAEALSGESPFPSKTAEDHQPCEKANPA